MKSVSVLIPNFNGFEAIQLCIESLRLYNKYPYKIIVYDDASYNDDIDLKYLRDCADKGWIKLIEGKKRIGHGGALTYLINNYQTDMAMILDNDVQITGYGTIEGMVDLMRNDIVIATGIEDNYNSAQPSLPVWFQSWFMMINMEAYRDGMEVDWRPGKVEYRGRDVYCPVGGKLWLKLRYDNPKGYKIALVPDSIKKRYHHFAHVSVISMETHKDQPKLAVARDAKMVEIKKELKKLRGQ